MLASCVAGRLLATPEPKGKSGSGRRNASAGFSLGRKGRPHALARERHAAQPNPASIVHGIGERRRHGRAKTASPAPSGGSCGRCTRSMRSSGTSGKGENGIARPIRARHALAIELDLLEERTAQGLQDISFDLRPHAVGIDHQPAIMRAGDAPHMDRARSRDRPRPPWRSRHNSHCPCSGHRRCRARCRQGRAKAGAASRASERRA